MIKSKYILVLIAITLACKKENNCIMYSGKSEKVEIPIVAFSSVEINDFIDFSWNKSPGYRIEVIGGKNYLPGIAAELEKSTLHIKNKNICKFLKSKVDNIQINVYCPFIDTLTIKGSGEIVFNDTMQNNLWVNCLVNQGTIRLKLNNDFSKFYLESGSNDIHVTGSSSYCDYYNSGINHFYARNFDVDSFRLHSRSKGVTEIRANKWLHIEQNGESDINYWGNPSEFNITSYLGNGDIIHHN
tara:strand:+ start:743 stop:1471 length:729 start_codon:yes stop_codon:yes gene_type:complete